MKLYTVDLSSFVGNRSNQRPRSSSSFETICNFVKAISVSHED